MNEETYQKILSIAKLDENIHPHAWGIVEGPNQLWKRRIEGCNICIVSACLIGKPVLSPGEFGRAGLISQFGKEFSISEEDVNIFIAGFDSELKSAFGNNLFWIAGQRMAIEFDCSELETNT